MNLLLDLSLEKLSQTPIALVSRKAEDPHAAPAAAAVLTPGDLRRAGALNLAEALRQIPGFHVGRVDANKWAVSARGFNGRFANKLLVLIDGRSVYTPLASGVYWEMQDVLVADLERVEVIRGPGAALWGANAVNGVVNLVSKRAEHTQGGSLRLGTGTEERALLQARYGGRIGHKTHYRVYGHYALRDHLQRADGGKAYDGWNAWRAGTRLDWTPKSADRFELIADVQRGDMAQTALLYAPEAPHAEFAKHRIHFASVNATGRWHRQLSPSSDFSLQSYFEYLQRRGPPIGELSGIWNAEFQHRFALVSRHELLWGLGYRLTDIERQSDTFTASLSPRTRRLSLFTAFAQDDVALVAKRLRLLLGAKFEHHEFTGWEFQPNARLSWTPTPDHALWAAAARAIRSSSRSENDIRLIRGALPALGDGPVTFIGFVGNRDFRAETLHALELGYRYRADKKLELDLAAFVNFYDHLRSLEGTPPIEVDDYLLIPFVADNLLAGRSHGLETEGRWSFSNAWSLRATYAFFHLDLEQKKGSSDIISLRQQEGAVPAHTLTLTLQGELLGNQLNIATRRAGAVEAHDISAHTGLDLHLSRAISPSARLALSLHNALRAARSDYGADFVLVPQMQVQRALSLVLEGEF